MQDELSYHRDTYGIPAREGGAVTYRGAAGIIVGASGPHVEVRFASDGHKAPIHPADPDLIYLTPTEEDDGE